MKTRVVVTGVDATTLVGNDVESFWQGLKDKTAGIGPIIHFDTIEYKCELAVEVKGFGLKQYMDAKAARRVEAFSQFAVTASKETLEQSGINMEKEDLYHVGVCVGSGVGPLQTMERDVKKLNDRGPSRVNPLLAPFMISDMAAGNVAIQLGLEGKCFGVVTICATGTHSIGEVFCSIQYGEVNAMVADGIEVSIMPINIAGFTSLTALDTTEDVSRTSVPFDEDRNGLVIGEGASVVVLESLEHAKARGADVLAEVVGYNTTCDAFHVTSPAKDRSDAAYVTGSAMKDVGIATKGIDYVSAHGISTHHNGLFETRATKLALGDHAQKVKTNSVESTIGHLLGAAGSVELITCVKSIQDGFVRATVGLKRPGEDYDLDHTMGDGVSINVDVVISNFLEFGGYDVSPIIKKFGE